MAWINAYSCSSAAGDGVSALWDALVAGRVLSGPGYFPGVREASVREILSSRLVNAVRQIPRVSGRYGVILASTKGLSEDFIWLSAERAPGSDAGGAGDLVPLIGGLAMDPLTPLLNEVLLRAELTPERKLCVSNACSSGLAALELAQEWLAQGLEQVLVLAADAVTPFVLKGFGTLSLISASTPKPFGLGRDGFFLGEAAAAILITSHAALPGAAEFDSEMVGSNAGSGAMGVTDGFFLFPIGMDSEGFAVARPSHSGESLVRAGLGLAAENPDLILAHGTGTEINDATEDLAFSKLYPEGTPPVTASKWCVGHTLAASALIDVILACEILKRGEAFGLATKEIDPTFKSRYSQKTERRKFEKVLISSLGFGGAHAMALISTGTNISQRAVSIPGSKQRVEEKPQSFQASLENESRKQNVSSVSFAHLKVSFDHFKLSYTYPVTQAPEWADKVERWYQLDAAAFGIAELYWQNRAQLATPPERIYLASPGASNHTDRAFTQAPGPAKFVHTLPNIRGAPLLKLMEWSGRVFCIQNDPHTLTTALNEAIHAAKHTWVVSALPTATGFEAHIFNLNKNGSLKLEPSLIRAMANGEGHDKHWLSSLETGLDR